ncbi:pectinesterase family protein [Micromonospora sp. NBC_01796]|uniref:pectinesterase family protein n=1 Tax=Micromonospora sp. NBC_01796 TaxID=2975987 RepID=UPI002DDBC355|nr:pectinesterase family protein [Micromonospora sp. NBC_01796]WSA86214.1 pectinesterase family protein [Micromonospora sp. NBC_01796]
MRRRTLLAAGLATGVGVAGPLTLGREAWGWPGPYLTVAADGSGDVTSIQAAVDLVPAGNPSTFTIKIKPGRYVGQVIIPADKPYLVFRGQGADPGQVVIVDNRANGTPRPDGGTWGTSGSASVTISGADFSARNLTFANDFDEAANPGTSGEQAVAVLTRADRLVFDNCRFLGNQDTLYVNSPDVATFSRAYFRKCYVEGDVDFIFGRGTAVFDRCEIRSLDRASTTNNGYVTAASTDTANPYGFLFVDSKFTGTVAPGTVYLGRPWHPSNDPLAMAQTVIRDSTLGAHVNPAPWTDFGTWSWRDARYAEYRNRGPGAASGTDRPQLTAAQAAALTPSAYLAGTDGWDPRR